MPKGHKRLGLFPLFHIALVIVYTAMFICALNYAIDRKTPWSPLKLPAREALRPELKYFRTDITSNPLAGEPRVELDRAWHDLLRNDNIKVPKEYIDNLNLHSIYTRDGTQGIASLSVFHSLHCLKLVRQMVYASHYHANLTRLAKQRQLRHTDHCIEYLRETITCKPDISLVTYRWINDTAQHPDSPLEFYPTNFDAGLHECANFNVLDEWAGHRRFDLWNLEALERPGVQE